MEVAETPEQREVRLAIAKAWRDRNPAKTKQYTRTKRERHGDRMRRSDLAHYHANAKALNRKAVARRRAQPEEKKEIRRARMRAYYRKNKLRFYDYVHRRRALKLAVQVQPEKIFEWMRGIKSKPFAFCYYCQKKVSTKTIQFDHVLALTKGGSHSISNLAMACRPCNAEKYNTPIQNWQKSGQQILAL